MLIIFYIKLFNKNEKKLSAIFGFSLLFCNRLREFNKQVQNYEMFL